MPPSAAQELREKLAGIPILATAGVSAHTRALVRDMFRGTYFRLSGCAELTLTRRGSRPGDPAADLLFAFTLSAYFRAAKLALQQHGLEGRVFHGRAVDLTSAYIRVQLTFSARPGRMTFSARRQGTIFRTSSHVPARRSLCWLHMPPPLVWRSNLALIKQRFSCLRSSLLVTATSWIARQTAR